MNKQDLASYMVNLLTLMETMEDSQLPRDEKLTREYERAFGEWAKLVGNEEKDGKRSS